MNASLERTGGYFEAQLRDSRAPWAKAPAPFITISRESCAGGSGLAQILLQKLAGDGWTSFGGNMINHLPEQIARFLPEDSVPEVNATIGEMVGLHPSLWELMQKANQTIRQLAKGGHVILVGRGANFATAGLPGEIHVRLIAPVDQRAHYYAQRFNVPESAALMYNAKCDAARRRYVKVHFNAEVADPAAYDLVINTGHVPLTEAADMVITHLRALEPVAA
jgi:cytidylate kinase